MATIAPLREELDSLIRLLGVGRRQWAILGAGMLLGTAAGFLHAANQPPIYAATAQVAIGNEPWRSLLPGEFVPASPYSERMTFDTQPLVIQSAPVAERAARNLQPLVPDVTSDAIRGSLIVTKIEGTRVFAISAEAPAAAAAKEIANGVADAYIQITTENRAKNAKESVRWLETQLADYEAKVQKSHQALIEYVEKENLTSRSGGSIATPGTMPLLEKLRQEKVQAELDLDRLSTRYGEKHPELLEKRLEVKRLEQMIIGEERSIRDTQKKNIGYDLLAGRAKADLELYSVLAKKLEQANISSSLAENAISVVQYAAQPAKPVRPNRPKLVFLGSLAGLLFAAGFALLRESLDQHITSAAQLQDIADLPILGSIPDVTGDDAYGQAGQLKVFSPTATAGSEAFRSLRANVKFAMVGIPRNLIVVTSCRPGEGKSMVTANLGAALAGAGQRVVVVDADLRRPALHRSLGLRGAARGLSTLIAGEDSDLEAVLLRRGEGEPDLLPAGPPPPNPGDFLESPVLKKTLERLQQLYDVVLIDSPPGDLFADALVLGTHAGAVLLVARCGSAERNGLQRLANSVRQTGTKTLGCVLNGVDRADLAYDGSGYYEYKEKKPPVREVKDGTHG